MQQCDQILDLRPLQQRGVADDQRRQARPFEFLGELRHVRLASEQHRHMRGIGGGRGGVVLPVPCDGLFGEACHGIDFLAEGGKSQHADRTFRGVVHRGQVRDVHFAHQGAAGPPWRYAQRLGEIVGGSEHDAGVASRDAERVWFRVGGHAEVLLEHAERSGTGTTPRINRLERVAHRVHRGSRQPDAILGPPSGAARRLPPAGGRPISIGISRLGVEQGGEEHRLRGGGVLVFVKQHVRVTATVPLPDGGESRDELVGGNGEIAEFRHVLNPLFPLVFLDERQQRLPTPGHVAQLCTLVHAYVTKLRPVFLLFGREGLLRVLLVFCRSLGLRRFARNRRIANGDIELREECLVPSPHTADGLVHRCCAATDHGVAYGMRQPQYTIHHGLERPEILLEEDVHVTADHGGRQLYGTGLAERLRVLVEADKQAVLPHDGLEERIVRRHLRLEERPVRGALVSPVRQHGGGHTRQQFRRGLARECEAEDALGRHALCDEVDDAAGHRIGLAAPATTSTSSPVGALTTFACSGLSVNRGAFMTASFRRRC